MHKPLTPILNRLDYPLEKLGAVRTGPDAVLLPAFAGDVEKALTELQAAIQERQEPFGANWQWEYSKIRRALQVLREYAKHDEGKRDDDLADVAGDFLRYAIDYLKVMTEELDERYSS
jgi:hypothetical protein